MYSISETHIRGWVRTSVSFFGEVSVWRSILNRLRKKYWAHFSVHTLGWMRGDSYWELQDLSAPEVAWRPDHPQLPGQVAVWRWHAGAFHMSTCLGHKVSIYLVGIALCVSVRVFGDDFNIHTDWLSRWSSLLWLNLILSVKDQNIRINPNCWLAPRLEGILPVRLPLSGDIVYSYLWTQTEAWG